MKQPVAGTILAVLGTVMSGAASADSLKYVVEGDRVVFTNTSTRPDARPVPGTDVRTPSADPTPLPATIYDPFIDSLAGEHGLSPRLIKAVVMIESAFDPHAVSPKGAQGLMQLMPATATQYGVQDAFDPLQNLRGGTAHLRDLLDEFDGDLTLALAAYNAGSGAVRRYGGVPAYPETRQYVDKIRRVLEGRAPTKASSGPPARPLRIERLPDGSIRLSN